LFDGDQIIYASPIVMLFQTFYATILLLIPIAGNCNFWEHVCTILAFFGEGGGDVDLVPHYYLSGPKVK